MTIEIEYAPGDIAWVMNDNRICKVRIKKADVSVAEKSPSEISSLIVILYYADNRPMYYSDKEVFKSKEALIQSL